MSQVINFLMILHPHKELTDQLGLIEAANQFSSNKSTDHRLSVFGKFTERDSIGINACPTCGNSLVVEPILNRNSSHHCEMFMS